MTIPSVASKRSVCWVLLFIGVGVVWWFVIPNLYKCHPLYRAVMRNDRQAVRGRLVAHLDEVDTRFVGLDATPLHLASGMGYTNMILMLLSLGADINAEGYRPNSTPLHSAALHGNPRIIELLIEHGANVNKGDAVGSTPLHYAANGDQASAVAALLSLGADISAKDNIYNRTPLEVAVEYEQVEAVRVLLEHGAEADLGWLIEQKKQNLSEVPLASAEIKDRFTEIISLLEECRDARNEEKQLDQ